MNDREIETALNNFEESFRRLSGTCKFQKTGNPNIFCSKLPTHWRSNKSLPNPFVVLILEPIPDGTKVTVTAGNEENCSADVKNNVTEINAQMARFSDLRFVGKSGRGKNFNLTITLHTTPVIQVSTVIGVIKVTVDGPRDSRNANKYLNEYRKRALPFDTTLPSTSQLDFTNSHAFKRSRFARHGLLSVGDFGNPLAMAATHDPLALWTQAQLNPMMLSMLSAVPLPPPIFSMAPNQLMATGLLPPYPSNACIPPITCAPTTAVSFRQAMLNSNTERQTQEKKMDEKKDEIKSSTTSLVEEKKQAKDGSNLVWRPFNTT